MNRTSSRCLLLASAVILSLAAVPRGARACGDEFVPAIDHRVMGIARAEKVMQEGKYVAAAGMILRMFPEIQQINTAKDPLVGRALRTLALATVRADGALPVDAEVPRELRGSWAGKTVNDRRHNLEWAASAMRRVSETRKDDPAAQTDLGEALAKLDGQKDQAKKLLAELSEKDLVASPEGYAALARLHAEAGDSSGRDVAVKRCQAMAKSPNACRLPGGGTGQS